LSLNIDIADILREEAASVAARDVRQRVAAVKESATGAACECAQQQSTTTRARGAL